MPIPLELARIILSDINSQQAIVLREKDGYREFPIIIGPFEARAIDRNVRGISLPRPMTHDLLRNAIEMLGGIIQDVYIHKLEEQTYFASLRVRRGSEQFDIDSRPSDAIAIATSFSPELPILIEEEAMQKAVEENTVPF